MSKHLADLLTNDHPLFSRNLADLEHVAGDGVDARLIGDITAKAHEVMRELGIDTSDTTAKELYHSLNSAVASGKAERLLKDTQYCLLRFEDGPVSFNIQDVIENAHHGIAFEGRIISHGQRHLRAQIVRRYAEHERTDTELVHKLAQEIGLKPAEDEGHPELGIQDVPSLLMIGDIFTDAFIQIPEDVGRIEEDEDGEKRLSIPFGSKPPYERVDIIPSVGPSPNAAVACARLGLDVSLMSWLGNDKPGHDSLEYLRAENIRTEDMQTQDGIASNYYYVLRYGAERTILVKNEEYDYSWHEPKKVPDWVYLSLIDEDSWPLHEDLLKYLEQHPETKLAFQPGTFHFKWGKDKLAGIYRRSHIVIMNREEAVDVTGADYDSLKDLTIALHELGPAIVVITDGPNGSYASYDYKLVQIPNYPDPGPPLDRTGAGDAFASTIVAGLALGKSMDEAFTWAPINSMNVVQKLGAQAGLLKLEDIKKYLDEAPEDYKVSEI